MSDSKPPQEPSMEEIIASISRSIAEDGGGREPVLRPLPEPDDILELTERLNDGETASPVADAGTDSGRNTAPRETPCGPRAISARIADERLADPKRSARRLLSEAAVQQAADAFADLEALPEGRAGSAELSPQAAGRTIEDVVHDALRPLLKAWLDTHLPSIVERLVREEIARVARRAGPG